MMQEKMEAREGAWMGLGKATLFFSIIGLILMWSLGIVYFRYAVQRQIEYTYRVNDNLASAFAAHTAQSLKEIEGFIRITALEYRRAGAKLDLPKFVKDAGFKSDLLLTLVVLDTKGNVVTASNPSYPSVSHAEREHFQIHVTRQSTELFAATPVVGYFNKTMLLPFSLRLSGPNGEFQGVIVAGVNPNYFIELYRKVDLGPHALISLFGLDGFIRSRLAEGEVTVGQDVSKAKLVLLAREHESGRMLFTSLTDNITRFYSYQRIPGYPLTITVAQAEDEALLEVNRTVTLARFCGLGITLLVLAGTALLMRGFSRDLRLQRSLLDRTVELQETNEQLEKSLQDLSRAHTHLVESEKMAALGGLVAGVAHEINTPIGIGVTASSHLQEKIKVLTQRYESGEISRHDLTSFLETARESTAMVQANLQRAAELIRSFKQVAVDQTGGQRRKFYIKNYLQETILSLRPQLSRTRHEVNLSCPEALAMYGNPGDLSQIVTNLVMNSLIHGFEGVEVGHIGIDVSERPYGILLRYSDDGQGIAAEHLPHIFEPFYTTKRGQGGSGLGLHVIYNIITQGMGGSIDCTSTAGQGVLFDIRIPRAAVTDANARPVPGA